MSVEFRLRKASLLGVKHEQQGGNNQDDVQIQEYTFRNRGRSYHVGILADGCSGVGAYSHSEVGAQLTTVSCLSRIQMYLGAGAPVAELPSLLYPALTNCLQTVATTVMPPRTYWPYDFKFTGVEEFRNSLDASERLMVDYLAATVMGFVDDGEELLVFWAGDGIVAINDEITVLDQNNTPEYPVQNVAGQFESYLYASADVQRLVLATDGLKGILKIRGSALIEELFNRDPENILATRALLKNYRKGTPEAFLDDCTVITRERLVAKEVTDATTEAATG